MTANVEEAGTWYYVVDCAICKALVPFKHAPEDEPIVRFPTMWVRCFRCHTNHTYASDLISRRKTAVPPEIFKRDRPAGDGGGDNSKPPRRSVLPRPACSPAITATAIMVGPTRMACFASSNIRSTSRASRLPACKNYRLVIASRRSRRSNLESTARTLDCFASPLTHEPAGIFGLNSCWRDRLSAPVG
jgi:hypothetical protein